MTHMYIIHAWLIGIRSAKFYSKGSVWYIVKQFKSVGVVREFKKNVLNAANMVILTIATRLYWFSLRRTKDRTTVVVDSIRLQYVNVFKVQKNI